MVDKRKNSGLWWIAWRSFQRLGIASFFFLTSGIGFCLFSMRLFTEIRNEKKEPFLLSAQNAQITEQELQILSEEPEISAVSAVYEISASVQVNEVSADITLYGMDRHFFEIIKREMIRGTIYPDSAAMPYLVLNEAACREILKIQSGKQAAGLDEASNVYEEQSESGELEKMYGTQYPDAFMSNTGMGKAGTVIRLGENVLSAGICGAVKDGLEFPAAYMSRESAQSLVEPGTVCQQIWLWLEKIGDVDKVTRFLEERAYFVDGDDTEQEMAWQAAQNLAFGFFLSGMISFAAAVSLIYRGISADWKCNQKEYEHLAEIILAEPSPWEGVRLQKELNFRRIIIQIGASIPMGTLLGLALYYFRIIRHIAIF